MSIKKMLMLVSAIAALVAFAAPAAAQAHWTWDEEGEIHLEGALATNIVGSPVTNGPCEVTFVGTASNNEEAHADIEGGEVGTPCNVSPLPGCQIEEVDLGNFPWTVTFWTDHPEVEIHDATFTNTYNSTCQSVYGLPKEISAAGTVTGTFHTDTQCITFNKAGHLATEPGGAPVQLNGEVCLTEDGPTLH